MTARELIKFLKTCNQDATVYFWDAENKAMFPIVNIHGVEGAFFVRPISAWYEIYLTNTENDIF